jgi:RNA polymerase sigma-70 factor, ECF subfamily
VRNVSAMNSNRGWQAILSDPFPSVAAAAPPAAAAPADPDAARDARLLARVAARGGDAEDAFAELFDRHAPLTLGLLQRMLGAGGEAEEVLQEVFLQAWRQAADYRPERKPVRGWLLLLARSRALDRLRSSAARGRREERVHLETGLRVVAPVGSERLEAEERRRLVARALGHLPSEQRQAVELAFLEGLTHTQIASRLGAPLGTVKSRVLLGMRKLRQFLLVEAGGRRRSPAAA